MSKLEEQICQILTKHFRCPCGSRLLYCRAVCNLANLTLEKCEEEAEEKFRIKDELKVLDNIEVTRV